MCQSKWARGGKAKHLLVFKFIDNRNLRYPGKLPSSRIRVFNYHFPLILPYLNLVSLLNLIVRGLVLLGAPCIPMSQYGIIKP